MYGHCKDLKSTEEKKDQVLVHNLLKDLKFLKSDDEAKSVLKNQILVNSSEENDEVLDTDEQIIRFLSKHSKYGKNIKEVELAQETLSSKIYKVISSEEEIAIKIPKVYTEE